MRADPSLVAAAVEESLRLEPAAAVVDRYATRDVELAGAAHRRRATWSPSRSPGPTATRPSSPSPTASLLGRENARLQVAFAHGPHVCVGLHLARLEAHVALERLLARLGELRLAEPTAPHGLVFRKPPRLVVEWDAF